MANPNYDLFEQLASQYDLQGLKELCKRLGVDPEDLGGVDNRRALALALVSHMERRQRIPELAAVVAADAPQPTPVPAAAPTPPPVSGPPNPPKVRPMALSNEQYEQLTEALAAAFPSEADLRMMLRFKLSRNLDAIAGGSTVIERAFNLIRRAEAEGWTGKLVNGAHQANPGNPELAAFVVSYGLSSVAPAAEGALELMLNEELPFQDFRAWLASWAKVEPCVCRIEVPLRGRPATKCGESLGCGTGFLVGKDLLLTAYHVVEPLIDWQTRQAAGEKWARPEDVRLRFDYARRENEAPIYEGTLFSLAPKWDVALLPYSKADSHTGLLPGEDELDFALVRVAGAPGNQPIGGPGGPGAAKRGWIEIPADPAWPTPETAMYILQHPDGLPLKLAPPDRIIGLNENKTRVRYRVNTLSGSSGSPCFSANLELIALHHYGRKAEFNQGVPLAAIAPKIRPYLTA